MDTKKTYKRKLLNFSVNRKMQFKMIGRISTILFVCLLLSSAVYFYFANQEIGASFKMFHIKAKSFLDLLLPVVCGSFVVSLVFGVIASLFFPKQYAGAMYRIEEDLKKVVENSDLTVQVKLREGDQAMRLASQVNTLLADLRQRIESSQESLKILDQRCEQRSQMTLEELQQLRERLQTQIGSLKV